MSYASIYALAVREARQAEAGRLETRKLEEARAPYLVYYRGQKTYSYWGSRAECEAFAEDCGGSRVLARGVAP